MATHEFTLVVAGADFLDDEVVNGLAQAGCDDAAFARQGGIDIADFDREADSFTSAVISAVMQIERALPEARVVQLLTDDWVTAADVAERSGRTRQSVSQHASAARGAGAFPIPTLWLAGNPTRRVWFWPAVRQYFDKSAPPSPQENLRQILDAA